jgi:uncharacterized membrane protein YeaQ/YmgE (transglycosylase-associated protein family)
LNLETMLTLLLVGGIAGLLADALVGGVRLGLLGSIIIGIIGAFIGDWLFDQWNITIPASPLIVNILNAFVGAVLLLFLLRIFRRA